MPKRSPVPKGVRQPPPPGARILPGSKSAKSPNGWWVQEVEGLRIEKGRVRTIIKNPYYDPTRPSPRPSMDYSSPDYSPPKAPRPENLSKQHKSTIVRKGSEVDAEGKLRRTPNRKKMDREKAGYSQFTPREKFLFEAEKARQDGLVRDVPLDMMSHKELAIIRQRYETVDSSARPSARPSEARRSSTPAPAEDEGAGGQSEAPPVRGDAPEEEEEKPE